MKTIIIRKLVITIVTLCLCNCSKIKPTPKDLNNQTFPRVTGTSLQNKAVVIPDSFLGNNTLLLIGYQQKAQFDIDRWILGVLQADIAVQIVEVPTIAGMMPQMVQSFINNGMRSGIPESDWAAVVTVYEDAQKIINAIGNERPQSAHAVLLDHHGRIAWSSNIGYSASQVLQLKKLVQAMKK